MKAAISDSIILPLGGCVPYGVQDVGVASTTTGGDENHLCWASLHESHKKAQRHGAGMPNYMYNSTCISVGWLHG